MADAVICPECGAPMALRETRKYTYPNGDPRKFWGCSRWPECNGIHGAHPDGSPLGTPATAEVKQWRIKAHAALDSLWKSGGMKRGKAYRWMQKAMGMTEEEAHVGKFDAAQCQQLIALVQVRADTTTEGRKDA